MFPENISELLAKNRSYRTIGFFDSGIGGMSVVNELEKIIPSINIVYLGDNENFPYGDKSHEELLTFINNNFKFLISKNVSIVGIACNTATAVIQKEYPDLIDSPVVFNPITSVTKYIKKRKDIAKVLVIGSRYTISSGIYERLLKNEKDLVVLQASEQLLIEYIEKSSKEKIKAEIERIQKYITKNTIDTLVLGCTHYGYIKDIFEKELKGVTSIIDPSEIMAQDISKSINFSGEGKREIVFTKTSI